MASDNEPTSLAQALSALIAARGIARKKGNAQLQAVWEEAAGPQFASQTRPVSIKNGVLHIAVAHSPLLSELVSFHRSGILGRIKAAHPELRIKDLKFKLDNAAGGAR